MEILKIVVISVVGCVLTVVINQYKPEFTIFIRLIVIVMIVLTVAGDLSSISNDTLSLSLNTKINREYIVLLVKSLVISVVFSVTSDICSDTGNKAIGSCVDLAGGVCVVMLAVPLISALLEISKGLILT